MAELQKCLVEHADSALGVVEQLSGRGRCRTGFGEVQLWGSKANASRSTEVRVGLMECRAELMGGLGGSWSSSGQVPRPEGVLCLGGVCSLRTIGKEVVSPKGERTKFIDKEESDGRHCP